MPHKIETEGLARNSFILRHLAHGNHLAFQELHFNRQFDRENSYGWGHHGLQLQQLVSELLIETSIKFRIIIDVLRKIDADAPSDATCEEVFKDDDRVGHFIPSMEVLRIRAACNKVIHADDFTLDWRSIENTPYECWTGSVMLTGSKGSDQWSCQILVTAFCNVLDLYLGEIDQRGDYIGTWHS